MVDSDGMRARPRLVGMRRNVAEPMESSSRSVPRPWLDGVSVRSVWLRFGMLAALVTLAFAWPLLDLVRFAGRSELFSHVFLIPLVSVYLVWLRRGAVRGARLGGSGWAIVPALVAAALLATYWLVMPARGALAANDYLSVMVSAFLALLLSVALGCLGTDVVRAAAFPLGFLVFMIPWPTAVVDAIETGLQYASAEAANVLFGISGMPFIRDGRTIELPGITIQVAQECSGVRSSYALLITSVLAGHVLLRAGWKRWVLALAVVPLGVVRNGIRIVTIGWLCVHVSPSMIDSPIHRHGGPVFFALSLIPFFLLLLWLRRTEAHRMADKGKDTEVRRS